MPPAPRAPPTVTLELLQAAKSYGKQYHSPTAAQACIEVEYAIRCYTESTELNSLSPATNLKKQFHNLVEADMAETTTMSQSKVFNKAGKTPKVEL